MQGVKFMDYNLPIFESANMRTLNYLAMPTSIIQSSPNFSYNYLLTKMLSLYSKNRNLQLKYENAILVPKCLPFPLWKALDFKLSLYYPKKNVKKCIIESLAKGEYVYLCVNEEFIPERYAFNRCYYYHEILVFGYCEDTDKFKTIGYNDNMQYKTQLISSEYLMRAYFTNKQKLFSLYKISINKKFNFEKTNKMLIKKKLFFYLNPIKKNHGINSYKSYICQLKKDFKKRKIDLRGFRTILDRAYVFSVAPFIGELANDEINHLVSKNYLKAKMLMCQAIKYHITKKSVLECEIISGIKEFSCNEIKLYKILFDIIK